MELLCNHCQTPSVIAYDDQPTILRGTRQVLAALGPIDDLRLREGQQNDLSTDLFLILSRHNSRHRRPVVVLLHTRGLLAAAVIFVERCLLGHGIGLLRSGDQTGDGAVIAPQSQRKPALLAAIQALLRRRRCHTVAASLSGLLPGDESVPPDTTLTLHTETAVRTIYRRLPLAPTFDDTLRQRFTTKKRKNLLYSQRALWKNSAVAFVPTLTPPEIEPALLQLAQHSWPVRTPTEIALHARFLHHHPESFCMGIRLVSGPWLSLVTGWRVGGVTHMPWQLNHDDYKDASLMQVMRTCLIEHECALGQSALSWVGGTVAFKTACEPELCLDFLQTRSGLQTTFLRRVIAPWMFHRDPAGFTGGSLMLLLPPQSRADAS